VKQLISLIFLLQMALLHGESQSLHRDIHAPEKTEIIQVDFFLSSTCPYCQKADAFLHDAEKKYPWLVVKRYTINQDTSALQTFYEHLQEQKSTDFSVPALFFCHSRWAGFQDAGKTGKIWLKALSYCHQKMMQQGKLEPAVIRVLQNEGQASHFPIKASTFQSTALFSVSMGLIGAVTPCSFFCWVAFLSFLWLYSTETKRSMEMGVIFLLGLGVQHYIQHIHTLLYYQVLALLKYPALLTGLLLLFTVIKTSWKASPNPTITPTPLNYVVVFFTAFFLQTFQQTCEFDAGLILNQWFVEQSVSSLSHLYYEGLFQLFYLLPMTIFFILYLIYERKRGTSRNAFVMRITARSVLMLLASTLVIAPSLFSNIAASIIFPLTALLIGWWAGKRNEHKLK
jgi:hypothetical protein